VNRVRAVALTWLKGSVLQPPASPLVPILVFLLLAPVARGDDLTSRFEAVQERFHGRSVPARTALTLVMAELEAVNEAAIEQFRDEDSSFFPSLYLAWGSCLVGIERAAKEGEGSASAAVSLSETSIPLSLSELQRFALLLAAEPALRDDERVRGALLGVASCLADAVKSIWVAVGTSPAAVAGVQTAPFWQGLQSLVDQGLLSLDVERLRRPMEAPTPAPFVGSLLEGSWVTATKVTGRLRVTLTLLPEAARAAKVGELRARAVAPGVDSQEVTVPPKRVTRVGNSFIFYLPLAQRESTVLQRGSRVRLVVTLDGETREYDAIALE